jgi:surface antigen
MEGKMGSKTLVASVLATSVLVSSCATQGSQNQTTGAVAGTAVGTGLGFLIPYGGGTLLSLAGGYVGARIGAYLDEKEKREMAEASVRAAANAKTGERVAWGEANSTGQPPATELASAPGTTTTIPPPTETSASTSTPTATPASPSTTNKIPKSAKPSKTKPASEASGNAVKTASAASNAASGYVVPVSDIYVSSKGQKCRDLQQVANKGGKSYQQKVQACQTAQGWVIPQG